MGAVLDTHAAVWYWLDMKGLSGLIVIDEAAKRGQPACASAIFFG